MTAFYNEWDAKTAAWLTELERRQLVAAGTVNTKSIKDLTPDDLRSHAQVHLFAGIGGWSYALRLAGWPDDRPVWTGSCPCQPFSAAGKRKGTADDRHLWPDMLRLIAECKPPVVFGEQVERAVGFGWIDQVRSDLEAEGYAVGFHVLGAHSVGAPHIRQRLWWVASNGADAQTQRGITHDRVVSRRGRRSSVPVGGLSGVAVAGRWWYQGEGSERLPTLVRNHHGLSTVLAGFGNAIVPQVAAEFVMAYMETQQ